MQHRRSAGYTLTEILVVVAIIGVLSLITVPAFMNFQRSSVFKSAMRTLATDLRGARTNAIKQSYDVRVELTVGAEGPTTKEYRAYASRNGTTWVALNPRRAFTAAIDDGTGEMVKTLAGPVWLESATNLPDIGGNGKPDIVFHPNGAVEITGIEPAGVVVLATNYQNIFSNRYNITITRSGQIRASTSQCDDGVDNDSDGLIDFGPDPQCSSLSDNSET